MKRTALIPIFAALCACTAGPPTYTVSEIEFSASAGSQAPYIVATRDGGALMSWWDRVEGRTYALRVAERIDGIWSEPATVVEGSDLFANWADIPSITELDDGTWVAHWPQKSADAKYAYHVMLSTSADRGKTWSESFVAHDDMSPTEHGFVSVVPWDDGAALVWLDGRQMGGGDGHGGGYKEQGAMTVRFATLGAGDRVTQEMLLDDRTCECCTTAIARTSSGIITAYRDRSEAEIRDIAIVRMDAKGWTDPAIVYEDNWHYPGCPVNGPQLSADGDDVALAWFSAPDNSARVQVAFSSDGGATFSDPIRVDDGKPSGRVDIEFLDDGSAMVSWLEMTDDGAEIRARRVMVDGTTHDSWLVAETSSARGSGFPRMTRVGDELVFAWTLVGGEGGVRVAAVVVD